MNLHELMSHVRERRFLSVDTLIRNLVDFEDEIQDCHQGSQYSGNFLMLAIIHDNEDVARFLCDFVNKVNKICRVCVRDREYSLTALTVAVRYGKFKMVELLLKHGADPNIACDLTPLGVAVQTNNLDMIELLLEAEADINIATHPVRMWANGRNEWHSVVEGLFGFDDEDLTMQTPLHIAARLKLHNIYNYLISKNALQNVYDGRKLLASDIYHGTAGNREPSFVCEQILKIGFGSKFVRLFGSTPGRPMDNVNAVTCFTKRSPLHIACCTDLVDLVRYLIQGGANINALDRYGNSPLHFACYRRCGKMVRCLIMEYNADIDVRNLEEFKDFKLFFYYTSLGSRGEHSMLTAAMNRQPVLNMDIRDKNGNTMLHYACRLKFAKEMFEFLIGCGADVNAVNNKLETPLHLAVLASSSKDLTSILLRHNAQLDRVNQKGYTPLMLACKQQENAFGIVTMLLASGAKVNGATRTSETPLHVACSEGFMNVVNLLVFVGADVNCENENRVTPLMIAFRKDDSRLACYLIENGARVDDNLAREINQRESSLLDMAFQLEIH